MKRLASVLVLALVLGGRAQVPATNFADLVQVFETPWPKNRIVNFVFHGHSVPAGYFKTPDVRTFDAYPHLLHVTLKQRFPLAQLNVIVTSIGGENSDSGAPRFERDVLAHNPDVVTIDYALNDRRLGAEKARKNLEAMLDLAAARKVRVILFTPTPDQRAKLDDPTDPLNQQADMIRALAAQRGLPLIDSLALFMAKIAAGTPLPELMSQVNHPNRAGHELVAAELAKWFPATKVAP
jgi:lysophospholipase L1-like esterase